MPPRFQKLRHIAVSRHKPLQKMVHIPAVAQVGGVITELDDIMIGRVHYQKLRPIRSVVGQPAAYFRRRSRRGAVPGNNVQVRRRQ